MYNIISSYIILIIFTLKETKSLIPQPMGETQHVRDHPIPIFFSNITELVFLKNN